MVEIARRCRLYGALHDQAKAALRLRRKFPGRRSACANGKLKETVRVSTGFVTFLNRAKIISLSYSRPHGLFLLPREYHLLPTVATSQSYKVRVGFILNGSTPLLAVALVMVNVIVAVPGTCLSIKHDWSFSPA
jgi:hypothetical protein